jgi:hypothetical protein
VKDFQRVVELLFKNTNGYSIAPKKIFDEKIAEIYENMPV